VLKNELFQFLVGICQGFILICAAWCCYAYYFGKIRFINTIQEKRKRKIRKYGWIVKTLILVCLLLGAVLIANNLLKVVNVLN